MTPETPKRRAASGEGTVPREGVGDRSRGRLLEVNYYPAGETLPAKYSGSCTARRAKNSAAHISDSQAEILR